MYSCSNMYFCNLSSSAWSIIKATSNVDSFNEKSTLLVFLHFCARLHVICTEHQHFSIKMDMTFVTYKFQ